LERTSEKEIRHRWMSSYIDVCLLHNGGYPDSDMSMSMSMERFAISLTSKDIVRVGRTMCVTFVKTPSYVVNCGAIYDPYLRHCQILISHDLMSPRRT